METKEIIHGKSKLNSSYGSYVKEWRKKYANFLKMKEESTKFIHESQKQCTNKTFLLSLNHYSNVLQLYESQFLFIGNEANDIMQNILDSLKESITKIPHVQIQNNEIPLLEQVNPNFLQNIYKILNRFSLQMKSPPPISPTLQSNCEYGAYEIKPYQKIISVLSNPKINMNLLVYHDMGTGKTCSITLSILQCAKHYQNVPVQKKIPALLVLIQNVGNIPRYFAEYEKGCTDIEWDKNTFILTHKNGHWVFKSKKTKKVFFEVYIQKMTVKHSITKWGQGKGSLPDVGGVFVDEAHNLFNTKWLNTTPNNYAKNYLKQIQERKDLKIFFFTGTPVADSESFRDLSDLLNIVVNKYTSINPDVDYWFEKKDNSFQWKSGKKMEMASKLQKSISYFTLEHDPTVYPRVHIDFKIDSPVNSTKGIEYKYNIDNNSFQRTSKQLVEPYVYVDVPSKPKNLKTGFSFKSYKESPVPSKWLAVENVLLQNRQKKHFLFMAAKTSTRCGMRAFTSYFQNHNSIKIEKFRWKDIDKLKFSPQHQQKEIDNFFKNWKETERYCILETKNATYGEVTPDRLLKFQMLYNDRRNTDGKYIRYVFSTQDFKEGIDLYSTQMVHFLEPVPSTSIFEQAIRRVARYCSMRYLPNVYKEWINTVIVYFASDIPKEKEDIMRLQSNTKSPVDLTLEVVQSSALDCQYFHNVTKVSCTNSTPKKQVRTIVEYCADPTGRQDKIQADSRQKCYQRMGVPMLHGDFNVSDEILYQLLKLHHYKAEPLHVTIWERFIHLFYASWFQKNEINLSQKIPVELLYRKIIQSPPKYGNSILYLLQKKRRKVSKEVQENASIVIEEIKKKLMNENLLKSALQNLLAVHMRLKKLNLLPLMEELKKLKKYFEDCKLKSKTQMTKDVPSQVQQSTGQQGKSVPKTPQVQQSTGQQGKIVPKTQQQSTGQQGKIVPKTQQQSTGQQGKRSLERIQKENEEILKKLDNRQKPTKQVPKCFQYFGLDEHSSKSELRKKYYKLALKYHPDKATGINSAQQKFKQLGNMYNKCLKQLEKKIK